MSEYPDLIRAIWKDDAKAIREHSGEPDVLDCDGRTGLMAAAIDGKTAAVAILLDAGADANIQDPGGWSALHFAAQTQSPDIVRLLLSAGADIDLVDSSGNTPLARAVFEYRGDGETIKILREAGADPTFKNKHGASPVSLARDIANFDVAQFFNDLPG